jgi:hypothetical protein
MKHKTWINLMIVLGLLVSSSVVLSTEGPVARAAPGEASNADNAAVTGALASRAPVLLPKPDGRGLLDGPDAPSHANAEGVAETAQPAGLEAMAADGLDPLSGNDTLVNWDKLLFSAYQNQNSFGLQTFFDLRPEDGDPPAVISVAYGETDTAGRDEAALALYWLGLSGWQPAEDACPGYEVQRFPQDNLIAVPVCRTGLFAFSDETLPEIDFWPTLFLPVVLRN